MTVWFFLNFSEKRVCVQKPWTRPFIALWRITPHTRETPTHRSRTVKFWNTALGARTDWHFSNFYNVRLAREPEVFPLQRKKYVSFAHSALSEPTVSKKPLVCNYVHYIELKFLLTLKMTKFYVFRTLIFLKSIKLIYLFKKEDYVSSLKDKLWNIFNNFFSYIFIDLHVAFFHQLNFQM